MVELIVATRNKKKFKEIKELLADLNLKVRCLEDYPDMPHIEEDGKNFAENAIKKAATIALYTRKFVMGEDSGLEVKALGYRPGVYSARFSGPFATDQSNNRKLLKMLQSVPMAQRQARYCCYVALADAHGLVGLVSGRCAGMIARSQRGTHGFGYDPLFLIPRYGQTFGQLDPAIKARMSHRARALKKMRNVIEKYLAARRG